MKPVLLFDMDGLLADSESLHQEAERLLFQFLQVDGTKIKKKTFGMKAEDALILLRHELNFSKTIEEAGKFWIDAVTRLFRSGVPPMPYAKECIHALYNAGYDMGLCSSSPKQLVDIAIESMKLREYFRIIKSGDDVKHGKPDPEIYLAASGNFGISPARCIVFEDSPAGAASALNAGMRCVVIPNRYTESLDFPRGVVKIGDLSLVTPNFISSLFPAV